ncbi:hypothetical protein Tco_0600722 [Tanacetum coccineum]
MLQDSWLLVGHPLHGNYRPHSQTLWNNIQDNNGNRTVNMAMTQGISIHSSAANASNDATMNARMDQLQNQLNQMIIMMQNNKETTGMPFMSSEGKPELIASHITRSNKFIASHISARRIMKMKPDIKNMTLNEYLKYEAKKEMRVTLDYLYYYKEVKIDKYYTLPPSLPFFQSSQPHTNYGYESPNESKEVDIDSMTIAEYELYIAKQDPDITIEDVERLRQTLTPPDDTYDALATDLILDEFLEEFRDEILDITVVDEEVNCNPNKDIEELERLLTKYP